MHMNHRIDGVECSQNYELWSYDSDSDSEKESAGERASGA